MLVEQGAKAEQLHITTICKAQDPDNTPDQKHRIVVISTAHPDYKDCPDLREPLKIAFFMTLTNVIH
jgi:hypothetical protein